MITIRFTKADEARTPYGDVRVDGETADPDPMVADIVQSWLSIPGKDVASFVRRYSQWSNGYLCSHTVSG